MTRTRVPIFALLAANTLSYIAEGISIVAIPWFVFELTGSAARVGLIGFFTVMPRVLAIFLGGQIVDRAGFRVSSVVSDVLSGISVCGIPLLYMSGDLTFPWLVVLVIVGAVLDGPGATAKEAMVPELASIAQLDLDRTNAFFHGSRRLSGLLGPVIAGFLVTSVGASSALWGNAVAFGCSALLITFLVPRVQVPGLEDGARGTFLGNITFGFRFLRQHRLLLWLAGLLCLTNFLDAPLATVHLPALVRESGGSASQLGILFGVFGAGGVLGTIAYSALAPRLTRRRTFLTCFVVLAPSGLVLASAPPYPLALIVLFVFGFVAGPINPILMSVRQERVPIQYRARVFGTLTTLAFISIPLGQLAGGYVVEWFGVRASLAAVAIVYIATTVAMVLSPVLHEMDTSPEVAPERQPATPVPLEQSPHARGQ